MALADAAHLLEFLDAKEIAQLLHARKDAVQLNAAVWHWIATRARAHLPELELPAWSPRESAADSAALVALLRRLHVVMTYAFDVRFDATQLGRDVRIADDERRTTNWGIAGGSIVGDRICVPNAVSYWEVEGLSDGSYVGITEEPTSSSSTNGFRFGGGAQQAGSMRLRLLSMPTPACDNMPAIMYCESGFITNGAFRGPRPRLPANVAILHAQPFAERDRVGVFVDLLNGALVFLRNGCAQGPVIAIDRFKQYRPVVSARLCYNLRLVRNAEPPWRSVMDFGTDVPVKPNRQHQAQEIEPATQCDLDSKEPVLLVAPDRSNQADNDCVA